MWPKGHWTQGLELVERKVSAVLAAGARLHKIKDRWVGRKWRQERVTIPVKKEPEIMGTRGLARPGAKVLVLRKRRRWAWGWIRTRMDLCSLHLLLSPAGKPLYRVRSEATSAEPSWRHLTAVVSTLL